MSWGQFVGGRKQVPPVPKILTGTYGSVGTMWGSAVRYNRTVASTFATGTIYLWQFPIYERLTVTSLGLAIRLNAGGAAKNWVIGIYADNNGVPGRLVGSTGVVNVASGASTGDAGVYTAVSIVLEPGHYWLAFATDTTRHAANWDLDVCQNNFTSANPSAVQMLENTGSFSATSQNNFPPYATEVYAWNAGTPLPTTSSATRNYTQFTPMLSIKMGF